MSISFLVVLKKYKLVIQIVSIIPFNRINLKGSTKLNSNKYFSVVSKKLLQILINVNINEIKIT